VSRKKNPNSRWVAGNERYPKDVLDAIYKIFREADGWHKGARVYKRR
jgi:hypothetical protein